MRFSLPSLAKVKGGFLKYSLDRLTTNPHRAQKKLLFDILRKNKDSEYGQIFNFSKILKEKDFQKHIPINQYQDLEPYIEKIKSGQQKILTTAVPVMFNLTSGTTDKPKYIPVTETTNRRTKLIMHQWLFRALLDHPSFLDKKLLILTSAATESYTSAGLPCGSVSGAIYQHLPRRIRNAYALPVLISAIKNYELRYYLMARIAMEEDVSFIATPNPTTLLKLAEIGIHHHEDIVQSIYEGSLSTRSKFQINAHDAHIINVLHGRLKPNRARAKFLSTILKNHDQLLPYHYWPSLKLIGCWLGGNIGYYAEKLSPYYGSIPRRDIGYLASEGCVTLPYEDSTPGGLLALQNNYYEFIPEEYSANTNPQIVLAHELEMGRSYKILLTNESGLYRYDLNDLVRVEKYYKQTPVLAFIRKTADFLNITGEKLHINHFILAFQKIKNRFNISISPFRVVANYKQQRYDIFVAIAEPVAADFLRTVILPAIDVALAGSNIEYAQKRASRRLNPSILHIMDSAWEEAVRKEAFQTGKRDIQYKWKSISPDFMPIDKRYIKYSIE